MSAGLLIVDVGIASADLDDVVDQQDLNGPNQIDLRAGMRGQDESGHGQVPGVLSRVLVARTIDQVVATQYRLELVDLHEEVETATEVLVDGFGYGYDSLVIHRYSQSRSKISGSVTAECGKLEAVLVTKESKPRRLLTSLLADDRGSGWSRDAALVVATFMTFVVADRVTGSLATLHASDIGGGSLLAASFSNRWFLYVLSVFALAAAMVFRWRWLLAPWEVLEHGAVLRKLAAALVVWLTWNSSLYDFNFWAGQFHGSDRLIVVLLAVAAIFRPLFLIPFVVIVRTINQQFLFPFGTTTPNDIDELLIVALLAVAAGHLVCVATRRQETSPVLLVISAAVASHFFVSGRGKLGLDWLSTNELEDLPLSSYTAGWMGSTGGAFAQRLADVYGVLGRPAMMVTLALELGAIIAVLHPRLLQFWLPGWIGFHVVTFATTGILYLGWTLLEISLLTIVTGWRYKDWIYDNVTLPRTIIVGLAVLAGPVLFHPPTMAWLDGPVSYGYEVEAVGESGTPYHVPLSALSPLDAELALARPVFGPVPVTGPYGAVTEADDLPELRASTDFNTIVAQESTTDSLVLIGKSRAFIIAFFNHANSAERGPWWTAFGRPGRFWTSRPDPEFDFDEPLATLDVVLVTTIHGDGEPSTYRRTVLSISRDETGRGAVVATQDTAG